MIFRPRFLLVLLQQEPAGAAERVQLSPGILGTAERPATEDRQTDERMVQRLARGVFELEQRFEAEAMEETKMENERAIEILDPEHREAYESLEPVNEACRMGVEALRRRVPESPYPDGDAGVLACPSCGSGEYLHNEDGNRCRFCGQCGQAIDWDAEAE